MWMIEDPWIYIRIIAFQISGGKLGVFVVGDDVDLLVADGVKDGLDFLWILYGH